MNSFPNFNLLHTNIEDHTGGIKIYNSGTGTGSQLIKYNWIEDCSGAGITIYYSTVDIDLNRVFNNDYGIMVYNHSNASLFGYDQADYPSETQFIHDNNSYEFYCSKSSFPHTFRWNAIVDNDNTVPLVYVSGLEGPFDVRHNAWGVYFDPIEDFYPWPGYIYEPVWSLMYNDTETDGAETLYNTSSTAEANGDFSLAQIGYYQIISDYPESKYADAAMKKLYSIESYVNNDYSGLKAFYTAEPNITNNSELNKLADFLVNFCEIKLENWPTAIAWFENIIQNPESLEDSIFAIIDLGYTYFLMEQSGYKNAYIGAMTEHTPVSQEQYNEKRDFLLSLLPGDQLSETMKQNLTSLNGGELLQNVPNPFNGGTQIWFKLNTDALVSIDIFSIGGKNIQTSNLGYMDAGVNSVEFKLDNLTPGIYFYTIKVNGVVTDTKKMTVVR